MKNLLSFLILPRALPLVVGTIFSLHAPLFAQGDAAAGKAKFDMFCVTCHGLAGAGDGPASAALNPKPKNLQVTTRTDDELKKIIKEGGASMGMSTTMVAWGGTLTDVDIENVVAYIRTLKK